MTDPKHQMEQLERYLIAHSGNEDPVLAELFRHTHLNETSPRMISGPLLGGFLTFISRMVSPARILEIGTFTGYSAICLAKGLVPGGRLVTLEMNDELRETAMKFFKRAGMHGQIELINGNAKEIIPTLEAGFDLVFLDGYKVEYPLYYDLVYSKVVQGGYILADNVLWGGKVLDEDSRDPETRAIREFNKMVTEDRRVENLMLPIRDGIMVIRKR